MGALTTADTGGTTTGGCRVDTGAGTAAFFEGLPLRGVAGNR